MSKRMTAGGVLSAKSRGNPGVTGGVGAFNNKTSWQPERSAKSEGKRTFMVAKS